jgi:hypothetical protein
MQAIARRINPPPRAKFAAGEYMRQRSIQLVILAVAQICLGVAGLKGAPIGAGDVLVYQGGGSSVGSGSNAAAFEILDFNPATSTVAQSFASTQLAGAGQIYTTTQDPVATLSLSDGGTEVSVAGWRSAGTSGTLGTTQGILRGVAVVNSNGQFSLPATYNPAVLNPSPDQPHTAYSPDGVNWYFGDTDGMYYNNGTAKLSGSDGTVSIKGFGSNTYALHSISLFPDTQIRASANAISMITPATPGTGSITYTTLLSFPPADIGPHDFYLLSSANNNVYNSLYITTNDGISKYALIGGTWTAEGTVGLPNATDIAARAAPGSGVTLYVTVAASVFTSSHSFLDEITDSAAFNATMNASSPAVLYTAPTGDELQGVSLAPVPEPSSVALAILAGAFFVAFCCRARFTAQINSAGPVAE